MIKPGCEARFDQWLSDIATDAQGFDGYQGYLAFPPSEEEANVFHVAFRFASLRLLDAFWSSHEYTQRRAHLDDLVSEPSSFRQETGIEQWFVPPTHSHGPPKHKMAVVIFLALLPLVMFIAPNLGVLLSRFLPSWIVFVVSNVIITVLMLYLAIPIVSRIFRPWLMPGVH